MRRIQVTAASPEFDKNTGRFSCTIATQHRLLFGGMITWIDKAPISIGIGKAYKKRTTGRYSQSNHYHGHLWQLVTEPESPLYGTDIDALDYTIRYRAISYGWKFRIVQGMKIPYRESESNTYEYGRLIDCLHDFADEVGFILYEGEDKEGEEERVYL